MLGSAAAPADARTVHFHLVAAPRFNTQRVSEVAASLLVSRGAGQFILVVCLLADIGLMAWSSRASAFWRRNKNTLLVGTCAQMPILAGEAKTYPRDGKKHGRPASRPMWARLKC
jgi:hypothetical protein